MVRASQYMSIFGEVTFKESQEFSSAARRPSALDTKAAASDAKSGEALQTHPGDTRFLSAHATITMSTEFINITHQRS